MRSSDVLKATEQIRRARWGVVHELHRFLRSSLLALSLASLVDLSLSLGLGKFECGASSQGERCRVLSAGGFRCSCTSNERPARIEDLSSLWTHESSAMAAAAAAAGGTAAAAARCPAVGEWQGGRHYKGACCITKLAALLPSLTRILSETCVVRALPHVGALAHVGPMA